MIAVIQRCITLGLVGTVLAWAWHFAARGEFAWAWGGALFLLFGYALFLAAEFALLAATQDRASPLVASPGQMLSAWWGEVLTAPQVFCWRQPFRVNAQPDHLPAAAAGKRGVVLVHGFFCNRAFWNPWMEKLRAMGTPFVAVSLEPVFGPIDAYVETLESAVRRVEAATGASPIVVAHSMGGLATRSWLVDRHSAERVHRVITIGSPHRGTWLARFGHTRNARQMRQDSPWLRQLAANDTPAALGRMTCIFSHCDNIVFPVETATLAGAARLHLPAKAHVQLAFQREAFDELTRWLGNPERDEGRNSPTSTVAGSLVDQTSTKCRSSSKATRHF